MGFQRDMQTWGFRNQQIIPFGCDLYDSQVALYLSPFTLVYDLVKWETKSNIDEQENVDVQVSVTQTLCDDDEDAHLLVQISKGELVGQRCDEEYIVQFELWQAALGQAPSVPILPSIYRYRKIGAADERCW